MSLTAKKFDVMTLWTILKMV